VKILVTGGAGFVGHNIVEELTKSSHEVVIFDNFSTANKTNISDLKNHENIAIKKGDVRSKDDLQDLFNESFDIVFHLSAIVGVSNYIADPLKVVDVNVLGTKNIIEQCVKQKSKLIFMSTSEIFGKNPNTPWKEDADRVLGSSQVGRWSYSTSKAVCEHMIFALNETKQLDSVILRYFNIYGPWQSPNFVISKTLWHCLRNEKPYMYDNGNQTRCFTYVKDAIEATMKVAFDKSVNRDVFNIGNSTELMISDAIKIILEETGHPSDFYEFFNTSSKIGRNYEDIPKRVPDVKKAYEKLGWKAQTQLREGIKQTIDWEKTNPWWLES